MSAVQIQVVGAERLGVLEKMLAGIPNGMEKAMRSAATRAVSHLRSNTGKAIRKRYDISGTNLRTGENVKVRYTYVHGVHAYITFRGAKLPLYRFGGASPRQPSFKDSYMPVKFNNGWRMVHPGVNATGHQLISTQPTTFEHAFVARMGSGHLGIFERSGGVSSGGNDAIGELMGSSIPQMLGSETVSEWLGKEAMEKYEERLEHEVLRLMNGW